LPLLSKPEKDGSLIKTDCRVVNFSGMQRFVFEHFAFLMQKKWFFVQSANCFQLHNGQ
jgi:hypothetical protein